MGMDIDYNVPKPKDHKDAEIQENEDVEDVEIKKEKKEKKKEKKGEIAKFLSLAKSACKKSSKDAREKQVSEHPKTTQFQQPPKTKKTKKTKKVLETEIVERAKLIAYFKNRHAQSQFQNLWPAFCVCRFFLSMESCFSVRTKKKNFSMRTWGNRGLFNNPGSFFFWGVSGGYKCFYLHSPRSPYHLDFSFPREEGRMSTSKTAPRRKSSQFAPKPTDDITLIIPRTHKQSVCLAFFLQNTNREHS